MLRRIHFVLVVVSVVQTLVLCIPFRDPYAYYPFKELYRDPFKHRFSDPYSIVDRLAQAQARESNVRQSASLSSYQYRLPQNLKPTKYDLTVVPFLTEGNFTFYGKVIIGIDAVQDASEIVMNSKYLKIDSLLLTDESGVVIPCDYSLDESDERLIIRPQSSIQLVAGRSYIVTAEYTGQLLDDLYGFYRSSYKIGSEVKWLGVTQFEPTHARRAFPCFDEPAFRAKFTVHVGRFDYQNSISNMRLKSTSDKLPQFENRVMDTYEESPHMPTYLVAFCVSEMLSVTSGDSRLRISMRGNAVDEAKYLIGIGETILKTIGDFVGVPYSLPKMDIIAVPDFNGAMENWGITTYRERYVLSEEGTSNTKDNQGIMTVVAHEFGHQWFGDLVTPLWWNYTWLNEAFATYFEYTVPDLLEPDWGMMSLFAMDQVQSALLIDTYLQTPMTQNVNTPSEIAGQFNYAAYEKGGSVLRMTEHFLTRSVFQTGLNYYLTSSSTSGIGTPERLFSALDAAAKEKNVLPNGITVANILNGWTTQGGSPLLTVNRAGNTITLSQNILSIVRNADTNASWYIPLTYTNQTEGNFQDTLAKDWLLPGINKTIPASESGWIIFNIQQTGFYRVNYDADNWGLVAQQLLTNLSRIHVINRGQLLDDAFVLAITEQLETSVFLNLTRYLSQEREYAPWATAAPRLNTLLRRFAGTNAGNSLKDYVIRVLTPYYQYLAGTTNVTHQTSLGRLAFIKWACELDISECNTYAGNAFDAWFHNRVPIDTDIRSAVLCAGVEKGGDDEWNAVWNLFVHTVNPTDRPILLDALACSQSEDTITKYLNWTISSQSPFKLNDCYYVCDAVASRPTGIPPLIRFIVNNYETIVNKLGTISVQILMTFIDSRLVADEHIIQIRTVVNNDTLPTTLREVFNATLTRVEQRRKWANDHQDNIQLWLDQQASYGSNVIPTRVNTFLCLLTVFIVYFTCSSTTFNYI